MNRQYKLEMQVSLPRNAGYNVNRVNLQFELQCHLLWRNKGGAPYATMKADKGLLGGIAQNVKGRLTCQRRGLYTITTAEGYSMRQLRENIAEAAVNTIAYFGRSGIKVTIQWELLTPAPEDNDAPETLSVPAEESSGPSAKSGPVDVNKLFDKNSVTPADDFSGPRKTKGGDPFLIDFD